MSRDGPSFLTLRTLEAVCRLKSFTLASKELGVTHSAVSQSVRKLEVQLGAALLERRQGRMEPSLVGARLARSYVAAERVISQAIGEITGHLRPVDLAVGLSRDFSELWLAGRISALVEFLPDVRILVWTDSDGGSVPDLQIEVVSDTSASDEILLDLQEIPVCTPHYANERQLNGPGDVLAGPAFSSRAGAWERWAARHDPGGAAPEVTLTSDARTALQAAIDGLGVCLINPLLAERHLAEGLLAAQPYPIETGEWLVLRRSAISGDPEIAERLTYWMRLEIARSLTGLRRSALGAARP